MKAPHVKISVRGMLFLVALIAAYLAGVASRRSKLLDVRKELDDAEAQLALENEQAAVAQMMQHLPITNASDLDRVERLLDWLEAYEAGSAPAAEN